MEKDLKIVRKGDLLHLDCGHGVELVSCAGRSPVFPNIIGFFTEDFGLFAIPEKELLKKGLKYEETADKGPSEKV